jgi:ATP-binding cassette subfamily C protein
VNLTLPAGSCTALIGPSGAGKSTLADILLGLITADVGAVSVDGQLLTPALARAWRAHVGYVPQETFLLPESVRTNLLLGDANADDAALWQALEAAAAAGFVRTLPRGLDSPVGERGTQLSGGERQRLALARALLRRPLLLVLDEATSALDAANQDRIGHALARLRGRVTILLIAHHSALVEQADQVVVLQAGRVSEVRRRRSGGVLDEQVAVLPHNGLALATNE